MYDEKKIYKIYSRKRFNIIKEKNRKRDFKSKSSKIIILFTIIVISVIFIIYKSVDPIFVNICEDTAKSAATKITNDKSSEAMRGYSYSDLFSIEKDGDGNIQLINANIFTIDEITSNISKYIQEELEKNPVSYVKFSIGSILGLKFFAGIGPNIKVKMSSTGKVETELKSEFEAQGINQTMHRIYLIVKCQVSILTPFKTIRQEISNQVLLAENIIVGQIPNNFYNNGYGNESYSSENNV